MLERASDRTARSLRSVRLPHVTREGLSEKLAGNRRCGKVPVVDDENPTLLLQEVSYEPI